VTKHDPTTFGGVDLVRRLENRVSGRKPIVGRIADKAADDYANVIGQAYAARGLAPTPLHHVRRATTFRAYDALTVVPRYGFASVDDYYTRACASRVLGSIALPTLVVSARHDPMLPWQIAESVRPSFSPAISFLWAERGGHAGFPRDLDLGETASLGLEPQVHAWLERNSTGRDVATSAAPELAGA